MAALCLMMLAAAANAQSTWVNDRRTSVPVSMLRGTGTVAVVVVGSAAKASWATTKFTARHVAKPIAVSILKPVVTKAAPKAALFAVKHVAPYALKLSLF